MKAKSENIVIVCLVCVLLAGIISAVILLCVDDDKRSKGVWWWSGIQNADEYLAFASQNGVTEIYFSVSDFSGEVNDFIGKANEMYANFLVQTKKKDGEFEKEKEETAEMNVSLKDDAEMI